MSKLLISITPSTGTYQEPQYLIDLIGQVQQTQANVTCYKHDYIGNIEYQNNQLEAYYTEEGRINYAQSSRHQPPNPLKGTFWTPHKENFFTLKTS